MGMFRVEIEATGGHGCQRELKGDDTVYGCGSMFCPDCNVRRFVSILKFIVGCTVSKAILTHWPGTETEVVDDLLTRKRTGSF